MSLISLTVRPGELPSAERRDALIRHLRRQMLTGLAFREQPRAWEHPWKVTASRFSPPEDYDGKLAPESTFALTIAPGTINDVLPGILYRRTADPRGWKPGDDYAAPKPGERDYDPIFLERDLLDDPEDPPFLALVDPPPGDTNEAAKQSRDWSLVPDDERPDAFKSEADWELECWGAHVIVSARPLTVGIFEPSAPPRLRKYRIYSTPRLPNEAFGALAGGWLELASLYLLRSQDDPEGATLTIRQREWWPLWGLIVTPGADILASVKTDPIDLVTGLPFADLAVAGTNEINRILTDIAHAQVADILEGASHVAWWTV